MFSMTSERWRQQKEGTDCPFCLPRQDDNQFWLKVKSLSVSTLYLHRVQTYRGYSVLVYDLCHSTVPSQLSRDEWASFCNDLHVAQAAIEKATNPDHMNIAALGNQMAHLHWHIIPRYENDSRWGGPIWMNTEEEMEVQTLTDIEHRELAEAIRVAII
jgi:diadenosine tetraphosphate (Ap4A) HIT family hydrolase